MVILFYLDQIVHDCGQFISVILQNLAQQSNISKKDSNQLFRHSVNYINCILLAMSKT